MHHRARAVPSKRKGRASVVQADVLWRDVASGHMHLVQVVGVHHLCLGPTAERLDPLLNKTVSKVLHVQRICHVLSLQRQRKNLSEILHVRSRVSKPKCMEINMFSNLSDLSVQEYAILLPLFILFLDVQGKLSVQCVDSLGLIIHLFLQGVQHLLHTSFQVRDFLTKLLGHCDLLRVRLAHTSHQRRMVGCEIVARSSHVLVELVQAVIHSVPELVKRIAESLAPVLTPQLPYVDFLQSTLNLLHIFDHLGKRLHKLRQSGQVGLQLRDALPITEKLVHELISLPLLFAEACKDLVTCAFVGFAFLSDASPNLSRLSVHVFPHIARVVPQSRHFSVHLLQVMFLVTKLAD
mmetsp:Transcript_65243/g.172938  ORF Transcript_65243/g.172938 Transcript_65243/m.172938 type:complete len:351 (+) Transcript_65243:588-1640(+)